MQSISDIISFIESDEWIMTLLGAVESLREPDCWVAAGAIRNPVWAKLHGQDFIPKDENDVDVVFFNPEDTSHKKELAYEKYLKSIVPVANWEVRNQARMHIRNNDSPYVSCFNALEYWAETPTAIGARLYQNRIEVLAPYGVEDLVNLIVQQTPKFLHKRDIYEQRIESKKWRVKWPLLTII